MAAEFSKGRHAARLACTPADLEAAQRLRHLAFVVGTGARIDAARAEGREADPFDRICRHMLVEEVDTGKLVCCFRLLPLSGGEEIGRSYSAQYYELSALASYREPMVEMGRFCIHPDHAADPDIIRVAWGAMTRFVDAERVGMLFGCSSFAGTEAEAHLDAFALLKDGHLAPKRWLPRVKAPNVFRFARKLARRTPDRKAALTGMPPLLRSYLAMGGWVSDHAVVDRDLNTLHVFTGLEIGAIPPARARLMRGMSA